VQPPLAIAHLSLPAREPGALAAWYEQVLGFQRDGAHLWSEGTLLVLEPGEPLPTGRIHFGFRAPSLGALLAWIEALDEADVPRTELEGDERYSTVFATDPEGNRLEFFFELRPAEGQRTGGAAAPSA